MHKRRVILRPEAFQNDAHNKGLAGGFVRFDSEYCKVLKFIHDAGVPVAAFEWAKEAGHTDTRRSGTAFMRLLKYGYIVLAGKLAAADTDNAHSAWLYEINHGQPALTKAEIRKSVLTNAERTKMYRDRKNKVMANSVFNLRGDLNCRLGIRLNDGQSA